MALIQAALTLIVLSILYVRMIKREIPSPIGTGQAVWPVVLGVFSLLLSFAFFLGLGVAVKLLGVTAADLPPVPGALFSAFLGAGLPEELAKLLLILLCLRIFRSRIRNVYEYVLIGAAVGFGFSVFEEFLYGGGGLEILRLLTPAAHMVFGVIMARHLGLARFYRQTQQGSAGKELALALLLPLLIHTVFDACTVTNRLLNSEDDASAFIGLAAGLAAIVVLFVLQFVVLLRFKKDTEKYCAMTLLPQTAAAEE